MNAELEGIYRELVVGFRELSRLHPGGANAPEGITRAETSVIISIFIGEQHGKEVRPSMIAEKTHVSKSALSQTVRVLEGKGLVLRSKSEVDSRAVCLTLTPEGRAIAEGIDQKVRAQIRELVEYIGIDDLRAMLRTQRKIVEFQRRNGFVEAPEGEPRPPFPPSVAADLEHKEGGPCA